GVFSLWPDVFPSPNVPFMVKLKNMRGTSIHTTLGRNKLLIMLLAVICPPIHSIVVVTSPIGDQAPPALAATTMSPAKNRRVSRLATSFRVSDTITMVVVRLSRIADRKNVTQQITHSRVFAFFVRM